MKALTSRIVIGIVMFYILGYVAHGMFLKRTVYGDGIFYYSWLHSIVVDHDINFANDYAHFGVTQPKTPSGIPGNKYSIGPTLLWAPLYINLHTILLGDGWSLPYQLGVGLVSLLAALTGLILLTRLQSVSVLVILLIAGATNLLFYGSLDTVNSHALSFFMAVVYIALLTSKTKHWFAVGLALGLLSAIRLQDAVFILLLLPYRKIIRVGPTLIGLIVAFLPQLVAWYVLYGSITNPYITGGERFDFLHPHILSVLFSPNNGLLLWTPIVAVGLIGLVLKWRIYWSYLAVFLAELLIVSCWGTWWQGASVSGRMFISVLPILAIGIADVVRIMYQHRILRGSLFILASSLCVINAMGIIYYLLIH